jgi:hypothetical protein
MLTMMMMMMIMMMMMMIMMMQRHWISCCESMPRHHDAARDADAGGCGLRQHVMGKGESLERYATANGLHQQGLPASLRTHTLPFAGSDSPRGPWREEAAELAAPAHAPHTL